MQKENLKILSNYLDKLMINRIESKSENHGINKCNESKCKIDSTVENEYYEQDFNFKNRKCNTNIYRKKLKRKINNLNNSFSGLDYPNIIPKIKLINLNKSQFINQKNCNDSNINNLLTNRKNSFSKEIFAQMKIIYISHLQIEQEVLKIILMILMA